MQRWYKLAEASSSNIVHTSSTRMELEAIRHTLLWLKDTQPNWDSIIIATDSMAVLTRTRNCWLPHGWHMADSGDVWSRITFMYVPKPCWYSHQWNCELTVELSQNPYTSPTLLCNHIVLCQQEHAGGDIWQTKNLIWRYSLHYSEICHRRGSALSHIFNDSSFARGNSQVICYLKLYIKCPPWSYHILQGLHQSVQVLKMLWI